MKLMTHLQRFPLVFIMRTDVLNGEFQARTRRRAKEDSPERNEHCPEE